MGGTGAGQSDGGVHIRALIPAGSGQGNSLIRSSG